MKGLQAVRVQVRRYTSGALLRLRNSSAILGQRRNDRGADHEVEHEECHDRREQVQAEDQPNLVIHAAHRSGVIA